MGLVEDQNRQVRAVAALIADNPVDNSINLIETRSVQEIQTIKDYLEQLKSDIRKGASSYVQDSVAMMEQLTTAIKHLKKKIEVTVNRVNSKAESKLLAIKAIEELIGFSTLRKKSFVEKNAKKIRTKFLLWQVVCLKLDLCKKFKPSKIILSSLNQISEVV